MKDIGGCCEPKSGSWRARSPSLRGLDGGFRGRFQHAGAALGGGSQCGRPGSRPWRYFLSASARIRRQRSVALDCSALRASDRKKPAIRRGAAPMMGGYRQPGLAGNPVQEQRPVGDRLAVAVGTTTWRATCGPFTSLRMSEYWHTLRNRPRTANHDRSHRPRIGRLLFKLGQGAKEGS